MKRTIRNIIILIVPFSVMVFINEIVRPVLKGQPYSLHGITAINPSMPLKEKCTWHCHNNTAFCKQNHVKHATHLFNIIDPIYFGVINSLKSTGNYAMANIFFLVVLLPLLMFYFFVKSLDLQREIDSIKNKNGIAE